MDIILSNRDMLYGSGICNRQLRVGRREEERGGWRDEERQERGTRKREADSAFGSVDGGHSVLASHILQQEAHVGRTDRQRERHECRAIDEAITA